MTPKEDIALIRDAIERLMALPHEKLVPYEGRIHSLEILLSKLSWKAVYVLKEKP